MQKISLGLVGLLLVLGIAINVWQGGQANRITALGYALLAAYLLWWLVLWIITSLKKK